MFTVYMLYYVMTVQLEYIDCFYCMNTASPISYYVGIILNAYSDLFCAQNYPGILAGA